MRTSKRDRQAGLTSSSAASSFQQAQSAQSRELACRRQALVLLAGALAMLAAGMAICVPLQRVLSAAALQAAADWTRISLTQTLAVSVFILGSALAGVSAAFLSWELRRLAVLRGYLSALHAAQSAYLARRAPLLKYGFRERGMAFSADGQALAAGGHPLAQTLPQTHATLILGDHGSGKSTVLRECGRELSRWRHTLRIALGHLPLPIFVSLPGFALAHSSGTSLAEFLGLQLTCAGAPELGRQLVRSLGRWHLLLLCDDLHMVPEDMIELVVGDLHALRSIQPERLRLAVTCDLDQYATALSRLASLREFRRVAAAGLSPDDLASVLRAAAHDRTYPGCSETELEAALSQSGLGAQVTHPESLASALALRLAGESLPPGRARLLVRYVSHLLQRVQPEEAASARTLRLMSRLAWELRQRHTVLVPAAKGSTATAAIASFLESDPAFEARSGGDEASFEPAETISSDDYDFATSAALDSGVLEWLPDQSALRFSACSIEAVLAAQWVPSEQLALPAHLSAHPSMQALEPNQWEPTIIRQCIEHDALRRAQPVDSRLWSAPRPLTFANRGSAYPPDEDTVEALALALAVALEVWVPALHTDYESSMPPDAYGATDVLRASLEAVASTVRTAAQHRHFAQAFLRIERTSQMDITGHLAAIAAVSTFDRLVRAHAALLLATLPSPTAARAVTLALGSHDPVIRQALEQALPFASAEVYAGVQQAIATGDAYSRHRAADLLARGGPAAAETARESLASSDARLRAAGARALGLLKLSTAQQELLARLDDSDQAVRLAAAQALGSIGDSSVATQLASRISTADVDLRTAIASACAELRDPGAVTTLLRLARDSDVHVRAAATGALGVIGDERAARALRDGQIDENPLVQAAAATALRRRGAR